MAFFIKVDIDQQPKRLLRTNGAVDVWFQGEWRNTVLSPAELDGLGGSSDYYQIRDEDVPRFQRQLND